jgi:hypothetical protein
MKKIFHTVAASLPAIMLTALSLRLYFLLDYIAHRSPKALGAIPFLFEPGNIAYSLAGGHGFASPFRVETGPTAWMTPVWPLFLAAIFRVFGAYTFEAFLAAALANVVFSALVCVPLYFAGRRFGVSGGAAWLWSMFPVAVTMPFTSLWEASLAALLAATILWATLSVWESSRMRDWAGYGLLWGAALMTSAAFLAIFPLLIGWLAVRNPRNTASAAAVALLCCLPWTVRNYLEFHAFVPLRSVVGLSLWVGNNEQADGLTPNRHPISNSAERAKYVERGEIAYMRDKQAEAIEFIRTHSAKELRLTATRFVAFWAGARPNWFRWPVFFDIFGAVFGAAGIVVLWRQRNPYVFPIAIFPLVFPLPYYVTVALPRYRLPVDPVLLLLAAVSIKAICQTRSK